MPIITEKEPDNLLNTPAEECALCDTPTRYWHVTKDVPVCPSCAETATEEDVPTKDVWCSRPVK